MRTVLLIFIFNSSLYSQNLVPNPSFEEGLPDKTITTRNMDGDAGRPFIPGWWVPTQSSPDIFNSIKSKANGVPVPKARTGKGLAGLVLAESKNLAAHYGGSYKEYLQSELKEALIAGKTYQVEFYLAADQTNAFYALNIGAYLSKNVIHQKNKFGIDVNPQIKLEADTIITVMDGWVKVCGSYLAEGGEKYITIGSFGQGFMKSYRQINYAPKVEKGNVFRNAYYYIDDVSVELRSDQDVELCITKTTEVRSVLIAIDDYDNYFIGENRKILTDGISTFLEMLPDQFSVKIIIKGCKDEFIVFKPITEVRGNINMLFESLNISDYSNDLNRTLINYLSMVERDSLKGVQVLHICAGKMSTNKKLKEKLNSNYAKNGTTFSVLQVNGKYSKATQNMVQVVKGEYLWSDLKTFKTESGQMGRYIGNIDNRVTYAPRMDLRVYFILGAVTIAALATVAIF